MISALYVETKGAYCNIPGIDPWDIHRDARLYNGPHAVVEALSKFRDVE